MSGCQSEGIFYLFFLAVSSTEPSPLVWTKFALRWVHWALGKWNLNKKERDEFSVRKGGGGRTWSCLVSSAKINKSVEPDKSKRPEFHISMCKPLSLFLHKGLVAALCHIYFFFIYIHSYINSFVTFAVAPFHIFTAAGSVGGTPLGVQAQIRTRAFSTALCHMSYATSHLMWATYAAPFMSSAAPFELHWTRYELYCAFYELRCTLYVIRCALYDYTATYMSYAAPYMSYAAPYVSCAVPYMSYAAAHYELRCTLY
jgi:hypothetical protein